MKLRACACALAASVLFSGCDSILYRSYSSSLDHVEYTQTEDADLLRAETYRGLVDAILYFVNEHSDRGVVRLYNYTGDVEADLDAACREILQKDPLAAFAVADISFECARIVSFYEATLSLTYSHTAQEVDDIRYAGSAANLRQELYAAMADFSPSLVLRVSYFPGDAETVRSMAAQAYSDTPQIAFGMPELKISLYPETGVQRIVEIAFGWPEDPAVLADRSARLLALARELMDTYPPAGERYTPEELLLLMRQSSAPIDPAGADDPYSALSGESAGIAGHALAMKLLCGLTGIECEIVNGRAGEDSACWMVVSSEGGWRHLLLTDEQPQLYTDAELTEAGYFWNTELYPPCVDDSTEQPDEAEGGETGGEPH